FFFTCIHCDLFRGEILRAGAKVYLCVSSKTLYKRQGERGRATG
ncbi:unnamed protein product, partial [marine sediment metagenome]